MRFAKPEKRFFPADDERPLEKIRFLVHESERFALRQRPDVESPFFERRTFRVQYLSDSVLVDQAREEFARRQFLRQVVLRIALLPTVQVSDRFAA